MCIICHFTVLSSEHVFKWKHTYIDNTCESFFKRIFNRTGLLNQSHFIKLIFLGGKRDNLFVSRK